MNINDARNVLKVMLDLKQPLLIHGMPGIGKSALVKQEAEDRNYSLMEMRGSQMDPTDLNGIPSIEDGKTVWNPSSFLPNESRDGEHGILFLDELTDAPRTVLAALYQLILDRRSGNYFLPSGWTIVAATNLVTDGGLATPLALPLANRLNHIELGEDIDCWINYALKKDFPLDIIYFLRFRPELLMKFDPKNRLQYSFPSPRSWERVCEIEKQGIQDKGLRMDCISSAIGQGAAIEYLSFLDLYKELPSKDSILTNADSAKVPENPGALYAVCSLLVKIANSNTATAVFKYMSRMPSEFAVYVVKDLDKSESDALKSKEYIQYAQDNKYLFES
jgi:hypothetical protein